MPASNKKWCTHGTLPPPSQPTCHGARLLWCTAADTNTPRPTPTKQGQCGHSCSERDGCSQSKVEVSNQASCSLKHPPGHSCFHACTQDAEFEGAAAWAPTVLLQHTSLMSVLYLPVLSSLKSCMAFRKPAGYFLLTSVGSESCPAERYCNGSLWKSSVRTAFSWDGEALCMAWKVKLGVCWELKLCVCLWGVTHSLNDVLQQQLTCLNDRETFIYLNKTFIYLNNH